MPHPDKFMIKRYLCGFLIITLLLCQPIHMVAEDILPPTEGSEPVEPTEPTSDDTTVETMHASSPDDTGDETTDEPPTNEPPTDESNDTTEPEGDAVEAEDLQPSDETDDETTDEPTEPPADEPIDEPIEPPADDPIDEPINPPTDEPDEGEDINPRPDIPPHLTINELMIGSEVNPEKDSWIEFYNPTDSTIDLSDWQIRGVTAGGRWINIVSEPQTIEPDGYFLFSYYSNSSYSALFIKPEMTKSSIFFEAGPIEIEIRDPSEQIMDKAVIEHELSDEFRSYERIYPIADGDLAENWKRSDKQINLKEDLLITFATPNNKNSIA